MAEIENTDQVKVEGPGKLLADARKKSALSVDDIATRLNLSVSVISQLESDKYKGDIPDAFVRGYLRTYARAVGQDEEEIIAIYSQAIGTNIVRNHYIPSNDVPPLKPQVGSHNLWFKLLSIVVFIVILGLGWIAYNAKKADVIKPDLSEISDQSSEVIDQPPSEENTLLVDSAQSVDKSTLDEPLEDSLITPLSTEVLSEEPVVEVNEPTELNPPQGFIVSTVLTDAELELNFLDDCWVQIIDSNDEVLAVGLKSAGRRFSVSGVPPIEIVLGKPRAVTIEYNQQMVDLSHYPASQTARFTLGKEG